VIRDITIEGNSTSRVTHHGGTRDYLAPELRKQTASRASNAADPPARNSVAKKAKFTRKGDVYAAGIVFLELVTLKGPAKLYDSLPLIKNSPECPDSLRKCLESSLAEDPAQRESFSNLRLILKEGREDIVAIPESFYFSSKRLSRISATRWNRDQKRSTLEEAERRASLDGGEIQKAMHGFSITPTLSPGEEKGQRNERRLSRHPVDMASLDEPEGN
jgi:serine/threonine protein kinase